MNVYLADFPGENYVGSAVIIAENLDQAEAILEERLIESPIPAELSDVEWTIYSAEEVERPLLAFFEAGTDQY